MKIPRLRHGAHIAGVAASGGLGGERRGLHLIFRQALQFVGPIINALGYEMDDAFGAALHTAFHQQ